MNDRTAVQHNPEIRGTGMLDRELGCTACADPWPCQGYLATT